MRGSYSNLQTAKNELKEIAKNDEYRMMLEITDGAIQVGYGQVHNINGRAQTPANGFEKKWSNWAVINAMVEIVKQHIGKITVYLDMYRHSSPYTVL